MPHSVQTTRALLQHLLTSQQGLVIQIDAEDFFLPWELLYPRPLHESQVTYQQFLGMNHIISRAIVQDERPGAFVPPEIPFDGKPALALLSDKKLPSVEKQDIPYFRGLKEEGKIRLLELDDLDAGNKQEGLGKLRDFLVRIRYNVNRCRPNTVHAGVGAIIIQIYNSFIYYYGIINENPMVYYGSII